MRLVGDVLVGFLFIEENIADVVGRHHSLMNLHDGETETEPYNDANSR